MAMSCGAEIPHRVDVLPDRPEVGARGVQIVRLAELLGRHALLHLAHAGVVEKGVADHQHAAGASPDRTAPSQPAASSAIGFSTSTWRPWPSAARTSGFVRRRRRRDHDRVDIVAREQRSSSVGAGRRPRGSAARTSARRSALRSQTTRQVGVGQIVQDARVIRSPVAEPDECEANALPGRMRRTCDTG